MADYGSPELNTLLGGATAPSPQAAPSTPAPASASSSSSTDYGSPQLNDLLGGAAPQPAPVTPEAPAPEVAPTPAPSFLSRIGSGIEDVAGNVERAVGGAFKTITSAPVTPVLPKVNVPTPMQAQPPTPVAPSLQATIGENMTPEETAAAEAARS